MVALGDHFPAGAVKDHVTKQLTPGRVIRIPVVFPQVTKPKFLVLVGEKDPDLLTFIVNSEINPFIANKPALAQCQVSIDQASHPFLSHDSHLACHDVLVLSKADVLKALTADISAIKGEISQGVRDQVVAAVKFAKTLDPTTKQLIIESLS